MSVMIKRKKFDETAVLKKNYNNIKRRDENRQNQGRMKAPFYKRMK